MLRLVTVPLGLAVFLGFACTPSGGDGVCTQMCRVLYQDCEYAAYPDFDSCLNGCLYNIEEGADVDTQFECVSAAAEDNCNLFTILECENEYGAGS